MGPFRQGKPLVLPTPELDEYEKELRARTHRKVAYAGFACILLSMPLMVMVGMAVIPDMIHHVQHPLRGLSPEARAKGKHAADEARARATGEEALMSKAIATAIRDGVTAHPELGRCPYDHSSAPSGEGIFATPTFTRSTEAHVCRACQRLVTAAAEIEGGLDQKSRDDDLETRLSNRIEAAKLSRYSVVLHVDEEVAPHGTPHVDFTPGLVVGRAFVWDTQAHRVACAGPVRAESSEVVDYTYTTQNGVEVKSFAELDSALKTDLRKRTEVAVADSLRYVAGPRIDD